MIARDTIVSSFKCYTPAAAFLANEAVSLELGQADGLRNLTGRSWGQAYVLTFEHAFGLSRKGVVTALQTEDLYVWRNAVGAIELSVAGMIIDGTLYEAVVTEERLATAIKKWWLERDIEFITLPFELKKTHGWRLSDVLPGSALAKPGLAEFIRSGAKAMIESLLGGDQSRFSQDVLKTFVGTPANPFKVAMREQKLAELMEAAEREKVGCEATEKLTREWLSI